MNSEISELGLWVTSRWLLYTNIHNTHCKLRKDILEKYDEIDKIYKGCHTTEVVTTWKKLNEPIHDIISAWLQSNAHVSLIDMTVYWPGCEIQEFWWVWKKDTTLPWRMLCLGGSGQNTPFTTLNRKTSVLAIDSVVIDECISSICCKNTNKKNILYKNELNLSKLHTTQKQSMWTKLDMLSHKIHSKTTSVKFYELFSHSSLTTTKTVFRVHFAHSYILF